MVMILSFLDRQSWTNSADPDQTAPKGFVCSGSTLFAISLVLRRRISSFDFSEYFL